MLAVGIDFIEIARIRAAVARYGDRFCARVYTLHELADCAGESHRLAARFAAKEAVSKALGVGIHHRDGVGWREIEVIADARGQPIVQLSGQAAQRAAQLNLNRFAVSLSHSRELAIAMVVAE